MPRLCESLRHLLPLALLFPIPVAAQDVDCFPVPLKWTFKQHDVVFVGRVRERNEDGSITFDVIDGLKNARDGGTVIVHRDRFYVPYWEQPVRFVLARYGGDGLYIDDCPNPLSYKPEQIATARRRAWWWRSRLSSIGWYPLRQRLSHCRRE